MPDKLKTGVIGVGSLGQWHARIYSELPDSELVGVFDADPARAREIADRYNTRTFDTPKRWQKPPMPSVSSCPPICTLMRSSACCPLEPTCSSKSRSPPPTKRPSRWSCWPTPARHHPAGGACGTLQPCHAFLHDHLIARPLYRGHPPGPLPATARGRPPARHGSQRCPGPDDSRSGYHPAARQRPGESGSRHRRRRY
jgi:hypothetical protein